jgi:hypothetical protein
MRLLVLAHLDDHTIARNVGECVEDAHRHHQVEVVLELVGFNEVGHKDGIDPEHD